MILVTGGTGFIGSYIIKNLLAKDLPVRAIRRSSALPFIFPVSGSEKMEWFETDIMDVCGLKEAMEGVACVIHAAAMVSFHPADQTRMYKVNVEGTENVVNMALESRVKRIIHVSSVSALGRSQHGETVTEEKEWEDSNRNTAYGKSKRLAEMQVYRGIEEGLAGAIINPSTVLGFGDWYQSSSSIFRNVYNEFPWYTKGTNGFVGVEDVAEAAVQLALSDISGERYIVSADNWTFEKLFNAIADGLDKRQPPRYASKGIGNIAWRIEKVKSFFSGEKPLLTRDTARIAQTNTFFQNNKLLNQLPGFSYTPLEDVIRNSCEKYLQAIAAGKLKA